MEFKSYNNLLSVICKKIRLKLNRNVITKNIAQHTTIKLQYLVSQRLRVFRKQYEDQQRKLHFLKLI